MAVISSLSIRVKEQKTTSHVTFRNAGRDILIKFAVKTESAPPKYVTYNVHLQIGIYFMFSYHSELNEMFVLL